MNYKSKLFLLFFEIIFIFIFVFQIEAQGVKRIVILKVDGLQGDYVDHFVRERDPATGKSKLPWFEEVFYKNGTRAANFYTRGMSLSGPAWSVLDTGQHLQLKGNVEYDRYTLHPYDYLNFLPLQINYGLKKQVDMPGVEVLDQIRLPLLSDAFGYRNRYLSYQLFHRGNQWGVLAGGFVNLFPRRPAEFIDEWTIGFDFRDATVSQNERDIIGKLSSQPKIDYFDYFTGVFDHISHHNNDTQSRFKVLKELDGVVGRVWMGIQASPRASETALFIISDHGFNSDEEVYSQGFNIVKLLASAGGGGHHVITKRRLMLDYSIKGVYPLIPLITTTSKESYYLKGQGNKYPTALVDFDGNERSSVHLRDSDVNILHILLQEMQNRKLAPPVRTAAANAFFEIINRRRAGWQKTIDNLNEELAALRRWIETKQPIVNAQPKKFTPEEIAEGTEKEVIRLYAQVQNALRDEANYREYVRVLSNLLSLNREGFDARKIKIEDYIAKGAMGERNSVYELQNYVVGLSPQGLTANAGGGIDYEKSFKRVDYLDLFQSQVVRNNVQPKLSNRPIDFVATDIPLEQISGALSLDLKADENPIWLYGGRNRQALILARQNANGERSYRYVPVANLRQQADGKFSFEIKTLDRGFPLKILEDENLDVPSADKLAWLGDWHTEIEWLHALHKTLYSNAIIGLNEQLASHPLTGFESEQDLTEDEKLLHRFRLHQRELTKTDLLLHASYHWNFDMRGFNPGGNHGSFYRISTNSTLMMAGGSKTGIPRGLTIEEPYDSLSFVPTVLSLMGKIDRDNQPTADLYRLGFRKFPGRIIREVIQKNDEE
jgi:hypothetical protein